MRKIKILLDENETPEMGEELLYKALRAQRTGESHVEDFEDPAIRDVLSKLKAVHAETIKNILEEVFKELDEEYSNDNF